jgi:hypothetical protein
MSDDDPINKALGIGSLPTNKYIASIVNELNDDSALKDFTFARSNIQEVIQNGTDAIAKLATIADQSQNPRAFEVLAKLMDTVVNASEKLLDVQKKVKEMTKVNEPTGDKTVTNNLFVGSTSDLQTILEKLKK